MPTNPLYPPEPADISERGKVTRPWLLFFQWVAKRLAAAGNVDGPATATDNAIARWDGNTGTRLQDSGITIGDGASGALSGTNTGDVTLAGTPNYLTIVGQVITRALINLASHVTGRLPFANLTAATSASVLLGRQSGSAGDFEEITVGSGLTMTGTTLSASGGGGSSGISSYMSAFASPPGSPNSGDLWFITDSFYIGRYNGSSWDYFHRGLQVYPPTTSGWSWDNQGTSTVTATGGALYFVGQTAASDSYRIYYRTAPATPYTVTAIILPHLGISGTAANFPTIGICFREASSGKFITLGQQIDDFFVQKWNGPMSFNSTTYSLDYGLMLRSSTPIYLRINDDGATNLTFSYSIDGINYRSIGTIGRTAFGTPDQYGLFVQAGGGGSAMTVISLKET